MAADATGFENGILYTAIGETFIEEAASSAQRVRELGIDYPIAIISDRDPTQSVFDEVIEIEASAADRQDWLEARLANLHRSPFENTVYLDTDTWVIDSDALDHLFQMLGRFDVVAPGEFGRRLDIYRPEDSSVLPTVDAPDAFPMYHAGIFGYADTEATEELLERWQTVFERHTDEWPALQNDQPAFREAIYQTNVNVGQVAPEYSFRLPFPQQMIGRVKIIHGRASNYEAVAAKLNERTDRRICHPIHTAENHPDGRPVDIVLNPGQVEILYRTFLKSVREVGLPATLKKGARKASRAGKRRITTTS